MKLKKAMGMCLSICLIGGMLAGCAKSTDSSTTTAAEATTATEAVTEAVSDASKAETTTVDYSDKKIVLLLPGSIDDQGWNSTNNAGAKACDTTMGTQIDVVESVPAEEFEQTFTEYGEKGYDLIMAAGSQFDEAASTVAAEYPDSIYCVINGQSSDSPNQIPIFPKEYEGSYLAGIIAGYATTNGQFAALGGESNDPMVKLLDTYEAMAVETAKGLGISDASSTRAFMNTWTDVSIAKSMTSQMMDNGADTIFCYSNEATSGSIQATQEKSGKFIGYSADKNSESDAVYASVSMDWPTVYPTVVANALNGTYTGKQEIGVKGGVFKVLYTAQCSDACKTAVETAIKDINDGKIDFTQYFSAK